MSKLASVSQRWMVAAGLVAALGFGAAQALASPAQAEARACSAGQCRKDCIALGNSGGICIDGQCICFIE